MMQVKKTHQDAICDLLRQGNCTVPQLRSATGWSDEWLDAVLLHMRKRALAVTLVTLGRQRTLWALADTLIARCPWSTQQVLQAVAEHEPATRVLAKMIGCGELPVRLILRRLQLAQKIKVLHIDGCARWVVAERQKRRPTKWPAVSDEDIVAAIAELQPVKLSLLSERLQRGEVFLARRIGVMRRAGLLRHDVIGDAWRYTLADYDSEGHKIALLCRDVGGDCTVWAGAHNKQGHPLVKHAGNNRRVDIVLWTAVHGLAIKPGHTLTRTCETPGCCTHEHHKQVTRSKAMRIAFGRHSFDQRAARSARAAKVRRYNALLTPERLARVRNGSESAAALALEFGCSKQCITAARRGQTYRDPLVVQAHPFDGLLGRRMA